MSTARERHEAQFGPHAERIRLMRCLVENRDCWGVVEAHHVKSRGAGGLACDLTPLCTGHHMEVHQQGIKTFQCRHMIDLRHEAQKLWEEYVNECVS